MVALGSFFRLILRAQTRLQFRPERFKGGRVALELRQGRAAQNMNALDRILETGAEFARRIPANDGGEISVCAGRDPDLQLADAKFLQRLVMSRS